MKKLASKLLPVVFSMLALTAAVGVHPACAWSFYQPEVPQALRK
jgi:cyclic lactone autoinducer peptide